MCVHKLLNVSISCLFRDATQVRVVQQVMSIPKQFRCQPELLERHCAYQSIVAAFNYIRLLPSHIDKEVFKKKLQDQVVDVHTDGK